MLAQLTAMLGALKVLLIPYPLMIIRTLQIYIGKTVLLSV
jgi:hypothetical protein